jgi:hypothetical protein
MVTQQSPLGIQILTEILLASPSLQAPLRWVL